MNNTDNSARPQEADLHFETHEGRKNFWSTIISIWLGTTMEYVDFALYGLAAGLVFGDVFFPEQTPILALLSSFATWAVGFIARPIGAIILGKVGDVYGRKFVLIITVSLMGLATTGIGLIPSYSAIGFWAPLLLVFLRICQGFGAGAELSGGAVMLAECAPTKHRGLVASLIGVGSNSGTLLASTVWLLVLLMPKDDVIAWGWRIPFLCSILVAVLALILRRTMKESPVFQAFQRAKAEKIAQATKAASHMPEDNSSASTPRSGWKAFFIMLGLRIGENGPSYMAQGFLIGYVAKALNMEKSVPTTAVLIASILGFAVIPLSGWLSDRFGRRPLYRAYCLLLVLYGFPAFMLLESRDPIVVASVIIVGMCLASLGIFGVQAAYGVELFGVQHRYSKMAVAKEVGSILSGGTAPMVASALLAATGSWIPLAVYFVVTAGIGLITTFFAPETRGRDLSALQDAI
ncbi:MFS transporter [Schaalia sp. lx-100]|uniref:MFS transporter n=1 Tax=Schaalia sp. lx-100 TaxID=2899081 RepID=UPI001E4D8B4D|nr:MFS transporter [Schaalia sp. lx-100]MCD4557500.1 MHS family MFS transporter [Schaalia sp. lx-100]